DRLPLAPQVEQSATVVIRPQQSRRAFDAFLQGGAGLQRLLRGGLVIPEPRLRHAVVQRVQLPLTALEVKDTPAARRGDHPGARGAARAHRRAWESQEACWGSVLRSPDVGVGIGPDRAPRARATIR